MRLADYLWLGLFVLGAALIIHAMIGLAKSKVRVG